MGKRGTHDAIRQGVPLTPFRRAVLAVVAVHSSGYYTARPSVTRALRVLSESGYVQTGITGWTATEKGMAVLRDD